MPITGAAAHVKSANLGDVGTISRGTEMAVINHYNIKRVVDIFGSVEGRDLGAAGKDVNADRGGQPGELAARIPTW